MTTWFALEVRVPPGAAEAVLGWAWEQDITGVEEDAGNSGHLTVYARGPWDEARALAEIAERLRRLGEHALPVVHAASFPEEDWFETWKRSWRPTPLGSRLLVVPSWWEGDLPGDRTALRLDPGQAFGTGTHVTTALAWELLETCLPGRRLLDVGAGSGILSLGALLLCRDLRVVATEADARAARALVENVKRVGYGDRYGPLLTRGVPCREGSFDLAVANLTTREHDVVAEGLVRALAPRARLVLSGIRDGDRPLIGNLLSGNGFRREERVEREGWIGERWGRP